MARAADRRATDTIYALSTGSLPAAIAVVRISGSRADAALSAMIGGRLPAARRASLRLLRDHDGNPIDRALVLRFPGTGSATGEDVVELHLHGGRAVVAATMRTLAVAGCREAEPGEFTRRALLSGRLDLAAAEGLADLIEAETETQHRDALRRSEGALGQLTRIWRQRAIEIAARVEQAIDHDEDDVVELSSLRNLAHDARRDLDTVLAAPSTTTIRDGLRVVLAGPPNAGKSALFNQIVGSNAAIVSDRPGTTRDTNMRSIAIDGLPFVIVDTAGVRDTDDPIEREGVARARSAIDDADIILDLGDADSDPARVIRVAAKADILAPVPDRIATSALTGAGMADLLAAIASFGRARIGDPNGVALDRRHREMLLAVRVEYEQAEMADDIIILAEHARRAADVLSMMTGHAATEKMLDTLFARFCLGK